LLLRTNNMHVLVSSPPVIFVVTFAAKDQVSLLVNLRKGMQSASEQPLVGRIGS